MRRSNGKADQSIGDHTLVLRGILLGVAVWSIYSCGRKGLLRTHGGEYECELDEFSCPKLCEQARRDLE